MTSFPGSPRLLKGAIVGLSPINPQPSVIVFQYNPDTLTRTVTAQTVGGESDRSWGEKKGDHGCVVWKRGDHRLGKLEGRSRLKKQW
ncbi:MAG: hypothetical protein HC866_09390 [Leptolyngbyaceae cyanobacterium RU_5_1]|nr:hypothetical protein [Leptolyngbyaceae cyanobacterium RU_5_1]